MNWRMAVILYMALYMVMAAGVVHNCFRHLYIYTAMYMYTQTCIPMHTHVYMYSFFESQGMLFWLAGTGGSTRALINSHSAEPTLKVCSLVAWFFGVLVAGACIAISNMAVAKLGKARFLHKACKVVVWRSSCGLEGLKRATWRVGFKMVLEGPS